MPTFRVNVLAPSSGLLLRWVSTEKKLPDPQYQFYSESFHILNDTCGETGGQKYMICAFHAMNAKSEYVLQSLEFCKKQDPERGEGGGEVSS